MKQWIRTCQSCGYKLKSFSETQDKSRSSYIHRKCPKCRSEDFDWGSWNGFDTKPWRDKWLALTGRVLVIDDTELDDMIYLYDGYLNTTDSDLYNALIKAGH